MNITMNDDFDLKKIAESGQCFRWEPLGRESWRIPFRDYCLRVARIGDKTFELDCGEEEYERIWRGYFDLEENYAAIRARIEESADPYLYRAAEIGTGIRILRQDLWETLVSFIISQNRNIPAIRRSVDLLCRAAGERRTDRAGEEYFSFPGPAAVAALSDEELKGCALGYRCEYVRAAAEHAVAGGLESSAFDGVSDEEAIERLMRIRGVGLKVASCTVLFALHRLNVFPVDTRIRKALGLEYPDGFPDERYAPYRGVYQQYMFALGPAPRTRS